MSQCKNCVHKIVCPFQDRPYEQREVLCPILNKQKQWTEITDDLTQEFLRYFINRRLN